jgi:hypothetical protein
LDRGPDLLQGVRHPQSRRLKRSPLVVIEDAPYRRAVVQDHGAGRIGLRSRGRCGIGIECHGRIRIAGRAPPSRRFPLMLQDGAFDAPEAPHLATHLDLGVAVRLQDRLGDIPQEMVVAVA